MPEEAYLLSAATYEGLQDLLDTQRALYPQRRPPQQRRAPQPASGMVWVKVTSLSTSSVTMQNGSSHLTCYPAVWSYLDSYNGTWTDNDACWFYPANGETPVSGNRYLCKCTGQDSSAKAIFLCEMQGSGGTTSLPYGTLQLSGDQTFTAGGGNQNVGIAVTVPTGTSLMLATIVWKVTIVSAAANTCTALFSGGTGGGSVMLYSFTNATVGQVFQGSTTLFQITTTGGSIDVQVSPVTANVVIGGQGGALGGASHNAYVQIG